MLWDMYSRCAGRYAGGTASIVLSLLSTTLMRILPGSKHVGLSRRMALRRTGLASAARTAASRSRLEDAPGRLVVVAPDAASRCVWWLEETAPRGALVARLRTGDAAGGTPRGRRSSPRRTNRSGDAALRPEGPGASPPSRVSPEASRRSASFSPDSAPTRTVAHLTCLPPSPELSDRRWCMEAYPPGTSTSSDMRGTDAFPTLAPVRYGRATDKFLGKRSGVRVQRASAGPDRFHDVASSEVTREGASRVRAC